jgi:sugar phosphate isomerase/epimerase
MTTHAPLSRREMLAMLGAAGLASFAGRPAGWPAVPQGRASMSRLGLQLYTVRDLMAKDLAGTLRAVGQIGYKEVETAGYFGHTAADVRKALDASGLTAPSAHISIEDLNGALPRLLDEASVIGHKWLVVPSLPGRTADIYKQAGEQLAKAAEAARQAGVHIAYHNHDVDFRPLDGTNGMEILMTSSGPEVAVELDVYWIVKAGGVPLDFIAKHPGRVKMLHLKDASAAPELAMRNVGAGTIDWPRLLQAAEQSGVEHCFVEHDSPGDSLASAKASFEYLSKLPGARGAAKIR